MQCTYCNKRSKYVNSLWKNLTIIVISDYNAIGMSAIIDIEVPSKKSCKFCQIC